MTPADLQRLAGALEVRPGQQPALRGGRPALAAPLLRGQPAAAAAQRLPLLYSLCGQAHRLTAELAVAAALHGEAHAAASARHLLQEETRREHLRRILLDWSRWLPGAPTDPAAELAAWHAQPQRALSAWLGDLPAWLEQWRRNPQRTLDEWSARGGHWLARALAACRSEALAVELPVRPLRLLGNPTALRALGGALAADPELALRPQLAGQPCETGCWSRHAEASPERHASVWLRLGARLAELAELALPGGRPLALGALALGPGEALAWSETARGLLLHRVLLDGRGSAARICDYQVLAPTEWNLHPQGALARALAALPSDPSARRRAELLLAAFDPCLAYRLELGAAVHGESTCHA